ncbi:MAG: hypothetical protein HYT37_03345 [Candidatus Sungbacteria bacterium]|nr:hypothetical protein [Candidatus Sungbacteria bacterium]
MYKREKLQKTLEILNKTLDHFGLPKLKKIPKGGICTTNCPVQKALTSCGVTNVNGCFVLVNNLITFKELVKVWGKNEYDQGSFKVTTEKHLAEFIHDFDEGAYPWLILKEQ